MKQLLHVALALLLVQCLVHAQDDDDDGMFGYGEFVTGTNPVDTASIFQLSSVALNPDTFIVTLTIATHREDLQYGILAHHGSPATNSIWRVVATQPGTSELLSFTDNVSGSLTHTGITYCGFLSLGTVAPGTVVTSLQGVVASVNEEFIAYPFLSHPNVGLDVTGTTNELRITYGEGIYSNQVVFSLPAGRTSGFFRMLSTNNDPVNAVIQVKTNLSDATWSNASTP
jgi:hypothetical protein